MRGGHWATWSTARFGRVLTVDVPALEQTLAGEPLERGREALTNRPSLRGEVEARTMVDGLSSEQQDALASELGATGAYAPAATAWRDRRGTAWQLGARYGSHLEARRKQLAEERKG